MHTTELSKAQMRILHLAATEYILHTRLQQEQLASGKAGRYLNNRWSHIADMLKLLQALGITREQASRQAGLAGAASSGAHSEEEIELRDILMGLSADQKQARSK